MRSALIAIVVYAAIGSAYWLGLRHGRDERPAVRPQMCVQTGGHLDCAPDTLPITLPPGAIIHRLAWSVPDSPPRDVRCYDVLP